MDEDGNNPYRNPYRPYRQLDPATARCGGDHQHTNNL